MEAVKQNMYPLCPKCNGEQVFNPRTQKVFCKAKCWLNAPQVDGQKVEVVKMNATDKDKSFYVAYAKDLAIAMLGAHVEARKIDNKIEPLAIKDIMEASVDAIKFAKQQFN